MVALLTILGTIFLIVSVIFAIVNLHDALKELED